MGVASHRSRRSTRRVALFLIGGGIGMLVALLAPVRSERPGR